jgi:hypothetical protein
MGQCLQTRVAYVGHLAPARPRSGFDLLRQPPVGIDVSAAHHHVLPSLATSHGGTEVYLGTPKNSTRRTRS